MVLTHPPGWVDGNWTHVGVDIVASCGSTIYAFADGSVVDLIDNTADTNFNSLGYMVIIKSPANLIGKEFYTLYLHMQEAPSVGINDPVKGERTIIGKMGDTGAATGCHTHFEIRYFRERFFPAWGNIYGRGDKRQSMEFKENWGDPEIFFQQYPNGITTAIPTITLSTDKSSYTTGDTLNVLVSITNPGPRPSL